MDPPRPPRQPRHVPEVGVHVGVELHQPRSAAADHAVANSGGGENARLVPLIVGRGEPELDPRIALHLIENRSEHGQAHRRRRLEQHARARVREARGEIVDRVDAADRRLPHAAAGRVVEEVLAPPVGALAVMPRHDAEGVADRREPIDQRPDRARRGVIARCARVHPAQPQHFAVGVRRRAHPSVPEPLVAELRVETLEPIVDARGGISGVAAAHCPAQGRELFDHQPLAVERVLDGAAHRSAGSVDGERQRDIADEMVRRDAQPQVPVLDVELAALVEAADGGEHVRAHHYRQRVDVDRAMKQIAEYAARRLDGGVEGRRVGRLLDGRQRRGADERRGMEKSGLGIAIEIRNLPLQLPRQPHIVGVEEREQAAGRPPDPGVARARRPGVLLLDVLDAAAELCHAHLRVVGRSIVDDDHFAGAPGLREYGLQRGGNRVARVERRDDDGDVGHRLRSLRCPSSNGCAGLFRKVSRSCPRGSRGYAIPVTVCGENVRDATVTLSTRPASSTRAATSRVRVNSRAATMRASR